MTAWGWAIINARGEIINMGCIKTSPEQKKRRIRKGDDTTRRASEIIKVLLGIVRKYDVQYILSESPHGSQNASAAVMIGMVAGIIQAIADTLDIGVEWYSEGDSKKALLGKLHATKQETIDAINKSYHVTWTGIKYQDEAIADAISIYHCARQQSATLKFFNHK
jgi:Holliday junction resolvasome RuvABC endonuclease subunit